jgi:DNA ligase-1
MIRFLLFLLPLFLYASKPELLLLKKYDESMPVNGWVMSEKLDGVRAYWNGKKLLSRSGKEFHPPKWFIKDFPPFEIDGELWSKRGDFENISSITSRKKPHQGWKNLTYNIFEVPNQKGGLLQRLDVLKNYLSKHPSSYIKIISQVTCKDKSHLQKFYQNILKKGGEGIVLRSPTAPYIGKRTKEALKLKPFEDSECQILGYKKGQGKYSMLMGSLICQLQNGKIIKIGSGLSDKQRVNPPKIGSIITFKYQGFTKNGLPRFPVFLRVRNER